MPLVEKKTVHFRATASGNYRTLIGHPMLSRTHWWPKRRRSRCRRRYGISISSHLAPCIDMPLWNCRRRAHIVSPRDIVFFDVISASLGGISRVACHLLYIVQMLSRKLMFGFYVVFFSHAHPRVSSFSFGFSYHCNASMTAKNRKIWRSPSLSVIHF